MRYVTTLTALTAFFVSGIAYAEEEPGPGYKHLKPMEWIIGTWVLEMGAPEDAPPDSPIVIEKGDPIKVIISCEWGLNKNILRTQMKVLVNDVLWSTSDAITGWATDKKQIIGSSFDTLGGREESVTTVDEKCFKMKHREVSPDGEITTVTTIVTRADEDSITSQRTDITVGGEKQPDEPPMTLQRKKKK